MVIVCKAQEVESDCMLGELGSLVTQLDGQPEVQFLPAAVGARRGFIGTMRFGPSCNALEEFHKVWRVHCGRLLSTK